MKAKYARRIRYAINMAKADADLVIKGHAYKVGPNFGSELMEEAYWRTFLRIDIPAHIPYYVSSNSLNYHHKGRTK